MAIVYAKHLPYDDGHLGEVVHHMRVMGPPIIRVVRDHDGCLIALEASHRLAACALLGIQPIFFEQSPDGELTGMDDFWQLARERLPIYVFGEAPIFTSMFGVI